MAKINLEKISEEQLERERNPNYKYFDVPELRYKDGRPMRKYNSPKLQEIEMENKNLTTVEWLAEKYNYVTWMRNRDEISAELADEWRKDYLEQAKQMEKDQVEISDEEIEKAAENYGWRIKTNTFSDPVKANELAESAKQDFIEGAKWQIKTSSQKEISDEEIEKFASDFYDSNGSESIFIMGAKWYREQLKKK